MSRRFDKKRDIYFFKKGEAVMWVRLGKRGMMDGSRESNKMAINTVESGVVYRVFRRCFSTIFLRHLSVRQKNVYHINEN